MAENVVSLLIEKLGCFLVGELRLMKRMRTEVRRIKDELESIRAFLRDADSKQESNEGVRAWVKQVRDVAYDIEDVIDEFMLRMAQPYHHSHSFAAFLCRSARFIKHLKSRHRIISKLQHIRAQVNDIAARKDKYSFMRIDRGSGSRIDSTIDGSHCIRAHARFAEEADLIGIENPRDELIRLLVEGGESKRTTVSLVGMGGLGKTTLAGKAYDSEHVKACFECYAWITVSQSFMIEEIFRSMIRKFFGSRNESAPHGLERMEKDELIEILRSYLHQRTYLIILDDIWSIDDWECIKIGLPSNRCGSRILVTTRMGNVAFFCVENPNHVYPLQPLSSEQAWHLFLKKTFRSDFGGSCPPDLVPLAENIVRKCGGLPLAIVTVGGLLSMRNQTLVEWKKLNDTLGLELGNNPSLKRVERVLSLSYNDLPNSLKYCFLYLSVFPEDHPIKRMRLIRLWIAEGFVERKEGMSLEEVADDYLHELIGRNMIQVSKRTFYGRVSTCRVHDVVHELILSKSREENFVTSLIEDNLQPLDSRIRRLSIHKHRGNMTPSGKSFSHVRSFFMFGTEKLSTSSAYSLFPCFNLLKVLDLEDVHLETFPNEIVNLFHLRYLSLRNSKICALPNSIGRLSNLETLDLKGCCISELPVEILKLEHLRHLLVCSFSHVPFTSYSIVNGVKVPCSIGSLRSLQKLMYIEIDESDGNVMIRELGKLTQLRRLGIIRLRREDGMDLCTSVEKMASLSSFTAHSRHEEEFLNLHSLLKPPPFLQSLCLKGRLDRLPHWVLSLKSLVRLALRLSRLSEDPFKTLRPLTNLTELFLTRAYDGEEMHCEGVGFERLKLLTIDGFDALKLVKFEKGGMPSLQRLCIYSCQKLEEVPLGIDCLTNLKELLLYDMPISFVRKLYGGEEEQSKIYSDDVNGKFMKKLRKDGVEDHWKIGHIPLVRRYFNRDGRKVYHDLS